MTNLRPIAFAALGLGLAMVAAHARPLAITLPADTSALKPGANVELVQADCAACHSLDYILTQPQGEKFKKDFWQAEVTKMINVYGAPIPAGDVPRIVDYLAENY